MPDSGCGIHYIRANLTKCRKGTVMDVDNQKVTDGQDAPVKEKKSLSEEDRMIRKGFDKLLKSYLNSNHRRKVELITKAFNFANQAHAGVKSGRINITGADIVTDTVKFVCDATVGTQTVRGIFYGQ